MKTAHTKPYHELTRIFERYYYLHSIIRLLHWDTAVLLPIGSGELRSKQIGTLETLQKQLLCDPRLEWYIGKLEDHSAGLSLWQEKNVQLASKQIQRARALTDKHIDEFIRATTCAEIAWRTAKNTNSFSDYAPSLERVINIVRERAELIVQGCDQNTLYNALISEYDDELTEQQLPGYFDPVVRQLPSLIDQRIDKQDIKPPQAIALAKKQQLQLFHDIMKKLTFSFDRGRLDTSAHPFTEGVSDDVRITTVIDENNIMSGLLAVLHETGHGLYDANLPQQWLTQPVGYGSNMSLHESQALLFEMCIGRSPEFCRFTTQQLRNLSVRSKLSPTQIVDNAQWVSRQSTRLDSDELCYLLHIQIRMELEKALIENRLCVKELPDAWNDLTQKLLGYTPKTVAEGCLQDIHWSLGLFGYFPTYGVGLLIAAQLYITMQKQIPTLMTDTENGQFANTSNWLTNNIWSHGRLLSVEDLMRKTTHSKLSSGYYLKHVATRYGLSLDLDA